MQDFPKLLPPTAKVGFSCLERWMSFTTVKNNLTDAALKQKNGLAPECAVSCEADLYYCNQRLLEQCGVCFEGGEEMKSWGGLLVRHAAIIIIIPDFGLTPSQLKAKIKGIYIYILYIGNVKIRKGAMVILEGKETVLDDVFIEGAVRITKSEKGEIIEGKKVELIEVTEGDPEFLRIRGYKSSLTSEDFLIL